MGSEVFGILANGPSATAEDALKLRSVVDYLIAINDAWRLCQGPDGKYFNDAIYGTDYKWWLWAHPDITRDFDGELITQRVQWEIDPAAWGITCFESEHKPGLCTHPGTIYTGSNSSYAAANVALHKGAKVVYYLGLDLSLDGGRTHAINQRPKHLNIGCGYENFIKQFQQMQPQKYGLEVVNLSRRTALNAFPLGDLDELCARSSSAPATACAA